MADPHQSKVTASTVLGENLGSTALRTRRFRPPTGGW